VIIGAAPASRNGVPPASPTRKSGGSLTELLRMSPPVTLSHVHWRKLPDALAYSLLALQLSVPWWAPYYVTQDGPSHIHTARAAWETLLGREPFHSVYRLQTAKLTNWATVVLFNLASAVFGALNAEKIAWMICVALAFWGFSYLARSLEPSVPLS